jgi:glucose-1-phosphate cytidylyltransferase
VLDTAPETMRGCRMKRARDMIGNETFGLTCGDGISNVDIRKLIGSDRERGKRQSGRARPQSNAGAA